MRFGASFYLWFLFAVPVIAGLLALDAHRRRRLLERLGDRPLVDRLSQSLSVEKRIMKGLLVVVAAAFLVLALARPQWGMKTETVRRRGVDVMVAVDTSMSMLSEDMKPNRLAQARSAIRGLFDLLQGDRVGLVAFAGTAYVACPLTLDYGAAAMFVDILDTDLLPVHGTNIAAAIRAATDAFPKEEGRHKVIVLVTDGEDHEGDVDAAVSEAVDRGIIIHTVGVGATGGVPIPIRNARGDVTGYKEDREHRKVTSRLDEGALQTIAGATHGRYFRSTPEGIELQSVYEEIAAMDPKNMTSRTVTRFEERYIIPLGAALLLLGIETALGDRRRRPARKAATGRAAAAAAALLLALVTPSPALADPAVKNNEGNRKYEAKRYDDALKSYTDAQAERPDAPEIHYNIGNVLLRKGEVDKAIEEYLRAQTNGPKSLAEAAHFNRGNALMMQEKFQPAIDAYVQALKIDPRDPDAKRNLELALRLLEKQQQQQQQQQPPPQNQPPDQKKPQQPPPQPDKEKQDDTPQPQPRPGEMSPDEAKQILEALRESEKESLKKHAQASAPPHSKDPEKDW